MTTFTEGLADQIQSTFDPQYVRFKKDLEKAGKLTTGLGAAALVTAVALLILGIALCATGNLGGIAAIIISLPLFYYGYNSSAIGSNIKSIAENPRKVTGLGGFGDLDKDKLRTLMKKGTFCMGCCIDNMIDNLKN